MGSHAMAAITFELVIIVALVLVNGIFAMAEIALISARKARLQQWASEGSARARTMTEHFWAIGARTLQYTETNPGHKARKETPCGGSANLVSSLSR